MPWFPLVQIAGLALLVRGAGDHGPRQGDWRISWIVGVPWLALLSAVYFLLKRAGARYPLQSTASSSDLDIGYVDGT